MHASTSGADSRTYQAASGYIPREFMDSYLLIPVGKQERSVEVSILNDVSMFIWTQLAQPKTFDALLSALLEEYDVSPAQAAEDIQEFLQKLEQASLLQTAQEEPHT